MKKVIAVALLAFLASQFGSGYPIASAQDPLPATGQTKCYDHLDPDPVPSENNAVVVDCGSAECLGQDGLSLAGCVNDESRFIFHTGPNGAVDDPDMPVDDTVTDRCTGLMWQAYTADVSGDGVFETNGTLESPDRVKGLEWCDALTYCENLNFAGFSDWRLPNIQEGQSLVEHDLLTEQSEGGAINPKFHVVAVEAFGSGNGTRQRPYWTSTHVTRKDGATEAMVVNGGSNYEVNDLLTVVGGESTEMPPVWASFKVLTVVGGAVATVGISNQGNPGKYAETPANPVATTSERPSGGPGGSGATLNVTYNFTRIAYYVNYEWGYLAVWDTGTNPDVRNGAYVRAVRSVAPAAGGGAGGDGAERGGGAGPMCADQNGDSNGDNALDLSDAIYLLGHLFQGGLAPVMFCNPAGPKEEDCADQNGDSNGDNALDLSDAIYLLGHLFQGGLAPVPICSGGYEAVCDDNLDDDDDGDTDCADSDCSVAPNCLGPTGVLPDTNQTACQDENGEVIDCASVGACAGQDSLTNNGCDGDAATRFVDNDPDPTVLDTCTGLLWLKALPFSAPGGAAGTNWCDQMAFCENLDEAGFQDWRLPNIRELQSIADYGRARPAMDMDLWSDLPLCCENTGHWSSTSLDADADSAYVLGFMHGTVSARGKNANPGVSGSRRPLAVRMP